MDLKPPNFKAGEANSANIWPKLRQSFEVFLAAADLQNADEKRKCCLLLHCIGQEGLDIFNTLEFKSNEVDKFDVLIVKFDNYFVPKINVTYERHKFFMRNQKTGENFENYVTELKSLSNSCDFVNGASTVVEEWTEVVQVSKAPKVYIKFKLDTGSQASIIPKAIFEQIPRAKLFKSNNKLINYNGTRIGNLGKCSLDCIVSNKRMANLDFLVVDAVNIPPI
ncbi:unnamed protein product [Ceutorhynchus assimilis]|uniref:Peptidase A2 domain-containing protein n=1 Tax=Ceutorhynchus assimilis TaxID=467358 RepID=A0A9N9MI84_9CUCU|nr:unnamed protein product [Ceutorhynchus assimilis]